MTRRVKRLKDALREKRPKDGTEPLLIGNQLPVAWTIQESTQRSQIRDKTATIRKKS